MGWRQNFLQRTLINQQEPTGQKTKVRIRAQKIIDWTPNNWSVFCEEYNIKKASYPFYKSSKGLKYPMPNYYVPEVTEINTKFKLAKFVYEHWGVGKFNVQFFSYGERNQRYLKEFACTDSIRENCLVFKGGRCPKTTWYQKPLEKPCKANPRFVHTFKTRACIAIFPCDELFNEREYSYQWITFDHGVRKDKMKLLKFFWKDD